MDTKHRATGNPRGRPPKVSWDLSAKIYESLKKRVDPATGLVRPLTMHLAREFGVCRTTIWRETVSLRNSGAIEIVFDKKDTKHPILYYRLH